MVRVFARALEYSTSVAAQIPSACKVIKTYKYEIGIALNPQVESTFRTLSALPILSCKVILYHQWTLSLPSPASSPPRSARLRTLPLSSRSTKREKAAAEVHTASSLKLRLYSIFWMASIFTIIISGLLFFVFVLGGL